MNQNQKFYGPEIFAKAVNDLTSNSTTMHPESYYEFYRKAIEVCNYVQTISEKMIEFFPTEKFLNSAPINKGDIEVDDFLNDLKLFATNDYSEKIIKNFILSYYNLCDFIDTLNDQELSFKEKSQINDKFNKVLILICGLEEKFRNYRY